jgi:diguanylate cyclase (GGDEF)-like protein
VVRASDTIIRIGGDEFVVIIGELKQHADAQACGEKLVEAFRRPILVGKDPLTVTCSVGGVVYPDSHVAPDDLLLKADLALYTAKEQGKNRYHIYSETEPVPPVKLEALVEEK